MHYSKHLLIKYPHTDARAKKNTEITNRPNDGNIALEVSSFSEFSSVSIGVPIIPTPKILKRIKVINIEKNTNAYIMGRDPSLLLWAIIDCLVRVF